MTAVRDLNFDIRARDRTQAAFDRAGRNARGFRAEAQRAFHMAGVAAKGFLAAFTVGALTQIGRGIRGVVAEAAGIVDTADKIGLTTDALQELRFAAQQSGVEMSALDMGMQRFSRRIAEVAAGANNDLARVLKANNVALRDQDGRLRSNVDLLADYADLIRGAASEQDRLRLAFLAFDSEGAAMVNTLRDGAAGLDDMMQAARDTGAVIDDELLRKAAEIDDEWEIMWTNFATNAKSAILSTLDWLDKITPWLNETGAALGLHDNTSDPFGVTSGKGGRVAPQTMDQAQLGFEEAFAAWRKGNTVIPDKASGRGGGGRGGGGGGRSAEVSAYQRVAEALEHELQLLGLAGVEQRILNEQRRAGVDGASAEGQAIAAKVRQIEAEIEAQERLEDQQRALADSVDFLEDAGFDAFWSVASGAESAGDAVRQLGMEIARAAAYALLFNKGPLAGLFGGTGMGGGGLIGALFGGFRARGGPVDPWKTYVVGERGPELLRMGPQGGSVVSNDNAFGGGERMHITFGLATDGALNLMPEVRGVARGEAAAASARAVGAVPSIVDARTDERQYRRLRPASGL